LRVLIYTYEFPPLAAGAGIYSADLAVGLASLGVEVHVATPFLGPIEDAHLGPKKSLLHFHYISQWETRTPAAAIFFLLGLYLRYSIDFVIVTERRAQEIVAMQFYPLFPYVAVIHGTEILDYFVKTKPDLAVTPEAMAYFYSNASICIAVSNATRNLTHSSLGGQPIKTKTIHNGINLDRIKIPTEQSVSNIRQKYGPDAELVLCVGRLDLDKGHDILLNAFKEVHARRPNTHLLICGIGPLKDNLMALRNNLGLESAVKFLGKIPQSALPEYYSACDVFAMPSKSEHRWEGLGLVYLEAGFFQCPVVGGCEGGVPEAIEHEKTGLIVDPRNHTSVAEAILRLLENQELRSEMGERGKKRVLEYFNSNRMAKETMVVLESLLKRESGVNIVKRLIAWIHILFRYLFVLASRIPHNLLRRILIICIFNLM
jgi:phosphatidyl-myo-inositol dimannoside synthase